MGIFKSYIIGFGKTFKKSKIVLYLWIFNLLFTLLAVAPIYKFVTEGLSRSLMGPRMLKGLDFYWVGDLINRLFDSGDMVFGWLFLPFLLFLLLYLFLNGGIIGTLMNENEKVSLKNFFGYCGAYFWRFFRLFLISIPFYIILVGGLFAIINGILELFIKDAVSEWPFIIVGNIRMVLFVLIFSIVNMLFDYAKISIAANDEKKTFRELMRSIKFLKKRFFSAWSLYLLIGITFLISVLVYLEVENILPTDSSPAILLLFVWHQVFLLSRLWIKVHFFSSQMVFYRSNTGLPE